MTKKRGEITNFSAVVSSGTIIFYKSREEFYLVVRNTVLPQGCFYVSLDWLARSIFFLRMDLELCFPLLQEMYLYKLQSNFALLLVVIVHFVMQYINFSDTLMSN